MKQTFILMAASALMMAGCSNEENTSSTYVAEGTPITVNAVVGEMQTKAEDGKTAVTKDFYLKIVNEKKPQKYSYYAAMNYANSAWSAYTDDQHTAPLRMYWAGDGQPVKVTAATFDFDTNSALTLKAQTNQMSSINGSDHLVMTETSVDPTTNGPTINVNFKHVMSKIVVKIDLGKETAYTQTPINELYIEGTETERNFSISDCTFSPLSTPKVEDITAYRSNFTEAVTDGTSTTVGATVTKAATVSFEAILVPQTVTKGNLTISFQLSDGKAYKWSTASDVTLATNTEYTLNLQLIGDKITMKNISVSPWSEVTKDLGTGVVSEATVEAIPVLTIDENNLRVTEERIAEVLKNGKLKIKGEMTVEDVAVLATNKTIEVLDLSEAKAVTEFDINSIAFIYVDNNSKMVINTTLKEVTLPNEMTEIAGGAFYNCTGLESVTIPANVTTIGSEAFIQCTNLKAVTFKGNALTTIGNSAFSFCTNLPGIELPSSVTTIGGSAFYGCSKLTTITLPDNLTSIGGDNKEEGSAFQDCRLLEEITIPSGVTVIPSESFYDCPNLKTVTCKGNVTKIGAMAFYNNSYTSSNLTSIYLTACTALPEIGDGDRTLPIQSKLAERVKIYVSSSLYSKLANATYYDRWSSQYCEFPDPSAN